jgi:hypothetical protein
MSFPLPVHFLIGMSPVRPPGSELLVAEDGPAFR